MTLLDGLFGGAIGASLAGPYANQTAIDPAMQQMQQIQQQNGSFSKPTTEILIREVSGGKIIEVYSKPNNHRVTRVCKEDDNLMEQIAAAYTEARLGNS